MDDQRAASPTLARWEKTCSASTKRRPCRAVAFQVEAEHRTGAARQQPLRQRVIGVLGRPGCATRATIGCADRNCATVGALSTWRCHAQRQRLDALQDLERVHRAHAGAEVAQALAAGAQQERRDGRFLGEHHAVEAVVRLGELGKLAGGRPSRRPESTSRPPTTVPCPHRNLVAEW
jgi:hypothetical protein